MPRDRKNMFRSVRVLLPVIVAVLDILAKADALFFRMPPNGKECLGIDGAQGEELVVDWEAIGGDRSLRVFATLRDKELFGEIASTGKQRLKLPEDGETQVCFKSLTSYVQTISFTIRTQLAEAHPEELATMDDSKKLETLVDRLETKVMELSAQQSYTTTRENVHRQLFATTNQRVLLWTSLKVLVWIVAAAFQVYYLKSFFEVKHFV